MTASAAMPGRVVMISGAGRGIGRGITEELLAHGWRVSAGTRQPFDEPPAGEPGNFHRSRFDATDAESEQTWVSETLARYGRIDAIVHNAGIASWKTVMEASSQEFDTLFEVNVKSPMRLTQLVWPHLLASGSGRVIVVASLAAKRVRNPEASFYSMSKAALLSFAHGIRHCGEPGGIRCTAILPGYVATDMAVGLDERMMRQVTQPADIAHITRMVLELPPTSGVSEIPINWRVEGNF